MYVQSLLGLLWSNAVSSNCMWTSLLLSPIAVATSPRISTAPWNGIGSAVDAISYTMSWRQDWIAWRTMRSIPHKPWQRHYRRRLIGQWYCLFIALLHKWSACCVRRTCVQWGTSLPALFVRTYLARCMDQCTQLWFPTVTSMFLHPSFLVIWFVLE